MSGRAIILQRRAVVARLLRDRGETLVVTGLGSATWDTAAAGDHKNNFYLWGGMGGAAAMGLGLAVAQPKRRVVVLTGDGEMLMGLGSLATIAAQRPDNLAVVVIDNQRYGETGMQETHTSRGVDLPGMAAAAGFATTGTVWDEAALEAAVPVIHGAPGPLFFAVKVTTDKVPMILPPRDGTYLKHRFREALLGAKAFE